MTQRGFKYIYDTNLCTSSVIIVNKIEHRNYQPQIHYNFPQQICKNPILAWECEQQNEAQWQKITENIAGAVQRCI